MMTRSRLSCFALFCAATLVAPATLAQPMPEMTDAARALYEEGYQASLKEDWALCKTKLVGAWAGTKHGQIAGVLGRCEAKLNQYRDAAEHLDYAIKFDTDPERRAVYQQIFDEVKKKVGTLTVKSEPEACVIRVDVDQLGDAPRTIFINPGKYIVEAKKDGYVTRSTEVQIVAGQDQEIEIKLAKFKPAPPPTEKPVWPGVVGLGLAAVGIGIGIGMTVASTAADSDAEDVADACRRAPTSCDATRGQGYADDRATFMTGGVVSFVAGGAFLVASIVYLAIPSGSATPEGTESAFQLVPMVGPGAQGVVLRGGF